MGTNTSNQKPSFEEEFGEISKCLGGQDEMQNAYQRLYPNVNPMAAYAPYGYRLPYGPNATGQYDKIVAQKVAVVSHSYLNSDDTFLGEALDVKAAYMSIDIAPFINRFMELTGVDSEEGALTYAHMYLALVADLIRRKTGNTSDDVVFVYTLRTAVNCNIVGVTDDAPTFPIISSIYSIEDIARFAGEGARLNTENLADRLDVMASMMNSIVKYASSLYDWFGNSIVEVRSFTDNTKIVSIKMSTYVNTKSAYMNPEIGKAITVCSTMYGVESPRVFTKDNKPATQADPIPEADNEEPVEDNSDEVCPLTEEEKLYNDIHAFTNDIITSVEKYKTAVKVHKPEFEAKLKNPLKRYIELTQTPEFFAGGHATRVAINRWLKAIKFPIQIIKIEDFDVIIDVIDD